MTYTRKYDARVFQLLIWFVGGTVVDVIAHFYFKLEDKNFFTPWHLLMYSGFAATAFVHLYPVLKDGYTELRPGKQSFVAYLGFLIRNAVPVIKTGYRSLSPAYKVSFWGCAAFLLGGIGDFFWHEIIGVEQNLQAMFSPSHIVLGLSFTVIASGPFRAFLGRERDVRQTWGKSLLAMLSLGFALSTFSLLFLYLSPYVMATTQFKYIPYLNIFDGDGERMWAFAYFATAVQQASFMLQAAMVTSLVVFIGRRYVLPVGSYALVFGIQAAIMSILKLNFWVVPGALLIGLIADLVSRSLLVRRPYIAVGILGASVPGALLLAQLLVGGSWWALPYSSGALFLSAGTALAVYVAMQFTLVQRRAVEAGNEAAIASPEGPVSNLQPVTGD